jgi:hypothetical protein
MVEIEFDLLTKNLDQVWSFMKDQDNIQLHSNNLDQIWSLVDHQY